MPCIDCGLATNADGKGRVDIDLNGGLTCSGTAGGTTNTAGSGLGIKVSSENGNQVQVDSNGLYVGAGAGNPFEYYLDIMSGGAVPDPNHPTGNSYFSDKASITLSNTSTVNKIFTWGGNIAWGSANTDPGIWMELWMRIDGGTWIVPSALFLPTGTVVMPLSAPQLFQIVAPGQSMEAEIRMRLYTGNLDSHQVNIWAWGGVAPS